MSAPPAPALLSHRRPCGRLCRRRTRSGTSGAGAGQGEIGCLVGSSGCGKTTLLRAVAGFLPVARGTIEIDGVVVSGPHFTAPPEKRGVGLVFQDYALFPHLRVTDNVAFGLRGWAAGARRARVAGNARTRGPRGGGAALSARAFGGPAAAGGARACLGAPPRAAADGRAVLEPRRRIARSDSGRRCAAS